MTFAILLSMSACLLVNQAELDEDQIYAPSLTRTEFRYGYTEVWCETLSDCDLLDVRGFASQQECLQVYDDALQAYLSDADCAYDGEAAYECLDGLLAATCEDIEDDLAPSACNRVCG